MDGAPWLLMALRLMDPIREINGWILGQEYLYSEQVILDVKA